MNTRTFTRLSTHHIIITLTTLLLALLIAPGIAHAASADDYADLNKKEWYMTDGWVPYAINKGLMTGYDNGKFGPYDSITRGQVATILYRYENNKNAQNTNNNVSTKFSDVPARQYYSAAVRWASEKGVVTGFTGTTLFRPDDPVTREQLATMIARYAGLKLTGKAEAPAATSANYGKMPDASRVSSWAKDAMLWCYANKIIEGIGGTRLAPADTAWRASMAKIMNVLIESVLKGGGANAEGQVSLRFGIDGKRGTAIFYSRNAQGSIVSATGNVTVTVENYSGPLEVTYYLNGIQKKHTIQVAKNSKYHLEYTFPVATRGAYKENSIEIRSAGASDLYYVGVDGTFGFGKLTVNRL